MNITHIRNATQIIHYAGKRFLIDPMLADKGAWPGFPGTARSELRNPLVELPFSRDKIVDVDAVIVTHTHDDHWDAAAIAAIPKTLPVFVQHEADAALLRSQGFQDLRLLSADSEFAGVRKLRPDVVVLNAGYAHVIGFGPIIMGKEDLLNVHFTLPEAKIMAIHLEAVNHCLVSREEMRQYALDNQIADVVSIPQDGETVVY
ncbi:MAG: MBL fold metallo-hydrolase [Klebsiella pneumoniae]|nr:MBL fold metallo-hydrolase [Klebsiella pneumoniae]